MTEDSEDRAIKTPRWEERFKLALAIMGLAGPIIAGAAFLGLQPEKRKELQFEYIAMSSLVNAQTDRTSIRVLYEGQAISQLTTVSARLANVGSVPIQEQDVESVGSDRRFPSIAFDTGRVRVLNCNVTYTNKPNIRAQCKVLGNAVQIEHGLLNSGDSASVEVQLEGDPGQIQDLPSVRYRIAGIANESTLYPSTSERRTGVTYFVLPRVADWVLVILGSIVAAVVLGVSCWGYAETWSQLFINRDRVDAKLRAALDPELVLKRLQQFCWRVSEPPLDAVARSAGIDCVDSLEAARNAVSQSDLPSAIPGVDDPGKVLHLLLREHLPTAVEREAFVNLPGGIDKIASSTIAKLKLSPDETVAAFLRRARTAGVSAVMSERFRSRLNRSKEDIGAAVAITVVGATIALIVTGGWSRLLEAL